MENLIIDEDSQKFTSTLVVKCKYCEKHYPLNAIHYCEEMFTNALFDLEKLTIAIKSLSREAENLSKIIEKYKNDNKQVF